MRNRFDTINVVFNALGSVFIVLGVFLLFPLAILVFLDDVGQWGTNTLAFVIPSVLAFTFGFAFRALFRAGSMSNYGAMLTCSLGWLGFSALGALPFVIGIHATYLNGFFEAMSGFTTTGITMFTGLERMPKCILFWRSMTQWIGGLGILTFFLAVTYRGGSAHRLFGAESHKIEMERPVPGLSHTLKILWGIYAGFTLIIVLGLFSVGMPLFDSVCHSFTALSTGGFSPYDASIDYYRTAGFSNYIWMEYILIIGMLMGGTNFLVHYRLLRGNIKSLIDNIEMKYWWSLISIFAALILLERFCKTGFAQGISAGGGGFMSGIEENFRYVFFQVVSIFTTTGFGTRDIGGAFFGHLARQLFLVMMVIGGCVGSTGGGVKVFRISILLKLIQREIFRLRIPVRALSTIIIDKKPVDANEVYRVSGLFFAWIVLLVVGGIVTAIFSNFDSYSAFSGMFSALGNIGPCYIPASGMGDLHPVIKIVYIFGMLAGRLEILPVLLIFSRRVWLS
ncbi:MAG: TrkH family potassium uptake protein [candidate division WOR-3 bacterium]|nr:TrkH family potassium uptake protein [candidate division WOR-3 bacterium]